MGGVSGRLRSTLFIGFLFLSLNSSAQTPDIFRLEYMLLPRNDAGAKLQRFKLVANMPIAKSKIRTTLSWVQNTII